MGQAQIAESHSRARYSMARKSPQPGPAVMRAGKYLAVTCLLFGAALAASVSGSLELRLGNLFVLGVMPAVGFYAGGYVLGQLLLFGVNLCDTIIARSSHHATRFANAFINWADARLSNWLAGHVHSKPNAEGPNGDGFGLEVRRGWKPWYLIVAAVSLTAVGLSCLVTMPFYWQLHSQHEAWTTAKAIHAVVEQIIGVESDGDPNAKNKRSSATGLGQFLEETWLYMISAHRPDLAKGRSQAEILDLRRDARIAREITARFTERNAELLSKRGLPVTPGTLYLAHFAGGAGAVAILTATGDADAALVMASADATGRTKREKIIKANPFLEGFTVANLRNWADRKMRIPHL
jgi:hypothetical protein